MNDIYDSPKSCVEVDPEKDSTKLAENVALQTLLAEQRYVWSPIIALVFSLLTMELLALVEGRAPILIFVLPAIVAGGILKYAGRLIQTRHRLISSFIVACITFLSFFISNFVLAVILAAFNFGLCLLLSRRAVNHDQERLLYRWRLGKLSS